MDNLYKNEIRVDSIAKTIEQYRRCELCEYLLKSGYISIHNLQSHVIHNDAQKGSFAKNKSNSQNVIHLRQQAQGFLSEGKEDLQLDLMFLITMEDQSAVEI